MILPVLRPDVFCYYRVSRELINQMIFPPICRKSFGQRIVLSLCGVLLMVVSFPQPAIPQNQFKPMKAKITYIKTDLSIQNLAESARFNGGPIVIDRYWNGKEAPEGRTFAARLLWSDTALYALFDARQAEVLIVSSGPDVSKKAMNLWDRDVVEILLAPDRNDPRKYFEFEAAPTGEWLDVALDSTSGKRVSDWEYASGMETVAKIEKDRVIIAIKIPWKAFVKKPKAGDVWLGNLLRCIGKDPDRGYLAWSPTMTKEPNFHVPDRFGEFHFVKY